MALRPVIDIPIVQWMEPTPESQHHGTAVVYDGIRYIYWLRGAGTNWFRRYDILSDTHQYLAGAPWNAGQGAMLALDPSRKRIWAIQGGDETGFAYYDLMTHTWTSVASLPAPSNWGSWIVHTCSSLKPGANDDRIYYAPANGSSALYAYSISGNGFAALASAPARLGAGSVGVWVYNYDPDKILVIRGGGTVDIYLYSISGNSWSTFSYRPATFGFSTGTHAVYDPDTNHVYISLNEGYKYIYRLDLSTGTMEPFARLPLAYGREARRLALVKHGGYKWLYVFRGYEWAPFAVWRIPIYY
jgi:hypothetical protein